MQRIALRLPATPFFLAAVVSIGLATTAPSVNANGVEPARIPTSADSSRALETLADDLARLVNLSNQLRQSNVGIYVRSLSHDREIFALNPTTPLTPASTTKVVTAFTAFAELGPDHMVRTTIGIANRPTHDGVLVGDVYVSGHGDPFLTAADIDALVDQFMATGIRKVEGNIVGDGTYFDEKTQRIQYSGDADAVEPLPPITALSIDNSLFTVLVSSPSAPGLPLNVQTVPRSTSFEIINEATSSAGRAAPSKRKGVVRRKRAELRVDADPLSLRLADIGDDGVLRAGDEPIDTWLGVRTDGSSVLEARRPKAGATVSSSRRRSAVAGAKRGHGGHNAASARSQAQRSTKAKAAPAPKAVASTAGAGGLKVIVTTAEDGHQVIRVSGSMLVNRRASYRYLMSRPAMVVAGMVHDRLASRGITITGRTIQAAPPSRVKVMAQVQRPLAEIVSNLMKNSNNYLAEMVFKMIGADAGARHETARASLQRISKRMSASGIDFSRAVINDGSGLSRANILTAETLTDILAAASRDRRMFQPFYSALSVAGVDGTLRRRLKGTLAEGNLHGKTGTLRNASALTGYVTSRDGELFAFAALMNGPNTGAYRTLQDRIAQRLAEFSYSVQ